MALVFVFAACATVGRNFDSFAVKKIKNGVTTKAQVDHYFGQPFLVGVDNGDAAWTYSYNSFGGGSAELSKQLYVVFDTQGLVKSHVFSTNFPDEMTAFGK